MSYSKKIAAIAGLFAGVNAHMVMTSPAPFNPTALSNGPLEADGSNFPCKFSGSYSASGGEVNSYALGSQQKLAFKGSAVHGGGSCQVSITYDENPTKDSVWKVIHSIEGGCPARDTPGNLPADSADFTDPYTYDYTIPSNIPAGKATIAWSWLNKIGNREFYMNCGALELTGEGGDKANFDKLPDMLVLNIMGKPSTLEGKDYKFENPGDSVEDNTVAGSIATCGTGGCTDGDSAPAAPATSATPSSAPADPAPSSGGAFITQPSTPTPTPTQAPAASSTPAAPAAPAAPAGGSGSAQSGACSPEGTFNCMGSSYQQCASGTWSVSMPMAAGTVCTGGQGTTLSIAASGRKRSGRSFRA
ncbi:hypothetical protein F5Y00DRAFT_45929 [Daldinia vernicosa]|uniref:uncharacterized protein n=1 Tax=Daldinia vernicosa TaxID=114800 RepID=UPI0020073D62|nr:uncharacterized protein F5Y00DRAFT_45929 [Daldinia vernicosa]KAI0849925.1 hypothetical protein F5Y00DRAFT_45929 [Daldinia vernicosa]